ncbi:class F sortase [Streptomyces sp. MMG1121]|uniref:class F sortase n=1 Tax=Streptomyces sp. MMG1121 TaxID=1415544 RepID=UPI0006AF2959|nr:class F sortase [Streptomyces sp. MMG1121]KOV65460.1 sortase [Streptomyces sp. MMG1121]
MAASPSPTQTDGKSSGRGGRLTLWVVAIVVLFVTVFGTHHKSGDATQTSRATGPGPGAATTVIPPRIIPPRVIPKKANPERVGPKHVVPKQVGPALPRSAPIRLIIPKIDVDAPFTTLTTGSGDQLQPPPADDTNLVGWYSKGAAPGESGTSVIAGHVDTTTSAAVFANLDELEAGDEFTVERADGRNADFVVDSAKTFAKDDFPSDRVYDDTPRAEARLITCAGTYDKSVKDYTDNLVVFAHLV